jgi:hypothetical protein
MISAVSFPSRKGWANREEMESEMAVKKSFKQGVVPEGRVKRTGF